MNLSEAFNSLPETKEGIVQFLTLNGYTGIPEDPYMCPLANYFKMTTGHTVAVTDNRVWDEFDDSRIKTTEAMQEFISAFDAGACPDLIQDDE